MTIWLRNTLVAIMMVTGVPSAFAHVLISVDKNYQQMSVSVNGMPRYRFTVSTGRAGYGTPSGTYHPQRLERSWFSREYYNSPMPHSIFFHGGFAIHGSYEISRLGGPASHGCIRLHPSDAAELFDLVRNQGMAATTIVVSGSNPTSARYSPEPTEPGYGQRSYPDYGQRAYPDYGQRSYPDYGQRSYPGYGQPSYPAYRQPSYPGYGQPSYRGYGQPYSPGYGQPRFPGYGQPNYSW
jgi:hypothetical protein